MIPKVNNIILIIQKSVKYDCDCSIVLLSKHNIRALKIGLGLAWLQTLMSSLCSWPLSGQVVYSSGVTSHDRSHSPRSSTSRQRKQQPDRSLLIMRQ